MCYLRRSSFQIVSCKENELELWWFPWHIITELEKQVAVYLLYHTTGIANRQLQIVWMHMNFTHTHPLDASWGTYSVRPFKGRAGLLALHLLPPAWRTRVVFCQAPLLHAYPAWLNLSGAQDSSLHPGTAPRKTVAHKCINTLYFLCQKNKRLIFQ